MKRTLRERELRAEARSGAVQLPLIALPGPIARPRQLSGKAELERWGGVRRPRLECS